VNYIKTLIQNIQEKFSMAHPQFPLSNLVPDRVDPRDYIFNIPAEVIPNLPPAKSLKQYDVEIENQLSVGSCVANATCSALEILLQKNNTYTDLSRLFVYWNARAYYEELRGKDGGAYVVDGMKSCKEFGVCSEDDWVYDVSQVNVLPPEAAYTSALARTVGVYERVGQFAISGGGDSNSVELIKATIAMGFPVVIGMKLGQKFYNIVGPLTDHLSIYPTPVNVTDNKLIGRHAMCVIGYDNTLGGFIIENSWGTGWGDGGYGLIKYEIIAADCHDAWTCTTFAGVKFEPEWNFLPNVPLTATLEQTPKILYLGDGKANPQFKISAAGGSGTYSYWWRPIGTGTAPPPNGVGFYATGGIPSAATESTANLIIREAELFMGNETEKTVMFAVQVDDSSVPTPQRVIINFVLRISRLTTPLDVRVEAAKVFYHKVLNLIITGKESEAKAFYKQEQNDTSFKNFTDEELSQHALASFGTVLPPEAIAAWKNS
jgi:hypothetical protein